MASANFRINGEAVGAPATVAPGGPVVATLDGIDGVRQVEWIVASTDETSAPGDYALVQSGSVGQTVSTTALGAGTAAILRPKINGGIDLATGLNDPVRTTATGKFQVLAASTFAVGCVNEISEADAEYGWAAVVNPALRAILPPGGSVTSVGATAPILNTGTAVAPVIALDYTLAATANKVPIRGASAEIKGGRFEVANTTYSEGGIDFAAAATTTIRKTAGAGAGAATIIRGANGAVGFAGGDLTIGPGIGGTPDTNAPGAMTIAVGSNGSVSGVTTWSAGASGAFLTVSYNIGTTTCLLTTAKSIAKLTSGSSIEFAPGGSVEGTFTTTGLDLSSGNVLTINGETMVSGPTGIATIGADASGRDVEIRAGTAKSIKTYIDGNRRLDLTGTALSVGDLVSGGGSLVIGTDTSLTEVASTSTTLSSANPISITSNELSLNAANIGFFGGAVQPKPTITGSRVANPALADLLTKLATLGILIDSTTI